MSNFKDSIKKYINSMGWSLRRYSPVNDSGLQLIRALELAGIDMVFDIGANEGQFAREIRKDGYSGRIVSFEPLSSVRERLLRSVSKDPAWEAHQQSAIGDHDGEVQINISGNSVSSSLLHMLPSHQRAEAESAYVDSELVPIARLDSLAKGYLSAGCNLFMKIDTQGSEWQVLDGAHETLMQARGLLCELSLVPLYEGQRLWRELVDRLDAEGFMLWALQKGFTDPLTGQSLQVDGLFLRRDLLR
jgi:FkbM family methyltransferase